ncbi:MAG TPA: methionine ABC transporter permease [Lachnospiraceae bacterium]|nr:methionine ABC transporter permease [Lachnospiraceae bacterium]HBY72792.1 methionine ABC transporter permease [Lachnospiraceae bacterium]HCA69099.1 methionine ABC transporter permease [Lachnospiraceae bacterium]HCM12583.1 methionine ABC transporter permease [Lachnospiraceae bacterium]HCR39916.1 methionine ABC transporter permease [Lachnospiraceae bacterium]
MMWNETVLKMVGVGILETLYMVFLSSFVAYLIGLPLGVVLVVTDKDGIAPCPMLNKILGIIVNFIRSIPFIILLVSIMPFTRFLIGTTIGPNAVVVPLILASAPYIARLVESSLKEVDQGVIEAAQSMGATTSQIIWKVLLPEAKPSLIIGSVIAITTILGYSAMAGFVGGGGLGDIAIRYGYYRKETDIALITVVLMVIIVQGIQELGARWMKHTDKKLH